MPCGQEIELRNRKWNYLDSLEVTIEFDNNSISCLPSGQEMELLVIPHMGSGVTNSMGDSKESK